MKSYALSLLVGLGIGVIYGLLRVEAPAPPLVALTGLLGMLIGEQIVPIARRLIRREKVTARWVTSQCKEHMFGQLPNAPSGGPSRKD